MGCGEVATQLVSSLTAVSASALKLRECGGLAVTEAFELPDVPPHLLNGGLFKDGVSPAPTNQYTTAILAMMLPVTSILSFVVGARIARRPNFARFVELDEESRE